MASIEIGIPGLNSSSIALPPSVLKAIWQRRSSDPDPVVSVSKNINMILTLNFFYMPLSL